MSYTKIGTKTEVSVPATDDEKPRHPHCPVATVSLKVALVESRSTKRAVSLGQSISADNTELRKTSRKRFFMEISSLMRESTHHHLYNEKGADLLQKGHFPDALVIAGPDRKQVNACRHVMAVYIGTVPIELMEAAIHRLGS